ncbi:hypothetical protein LTR27_001232 [Elasticomyces elasticus]|nr:hypothetical protein LTR27_001232 [Elasticomyces elasticus]
MTRNEALDGPIKIHGWRFKATLFTGAGVGYTVKPAVMDSKGENNFVSYEVVRRMGLTRSIERLSGEVTKNHRDGTQWKFNQGIELNLNIAGIVWPVDFIVDYRLNARHLELGQSGILDFNAQAERMVTPKKQVVPRVTVWEQGMGHRKHPVEFIGATAQTITVEAAGTWEQHIHARGESITERKNRLAGLQRAETERIRRAQEALDVEYWRRRAAIH